MTKNCKKFISVGFRQFTSLVIIAGQIIIWCWLHGDKVLYVKIALRYVEFKLFLHFLALPNFCWTYLFDYLAKSDFLKLLLSSTKAKFFSKKKEMVCWTCQLWLGLKYNNGNGPSVSDAACFHCCYYCFGGQRKPRPRTFGEPPSAVLAHTLLWGWFKRTGKRGDFNIYFRGSAIRGGEIHPNFPISIGGKLSKFAKHRWVPFWLEIYFIQTALWYR